MLRNVSYNNKEIKREIQDAVGNSYTLIERLRKGGVGSQRLLIFEASREIQDLLDLDNNLNHCNIELREKGIIVRFRSILNTYGWIIPFYRLSLFKNAGHLAIYAEDQFIKIRPAHNEKLNNNFFKKLIGLKTAYYELNKLPV